MKVEITLTDEMLGTKAANPDVFADYIASKATDPKKKKQEVKTASEMAADLEEDAAEREKAGTTIFHVDDAGHPVLYDYQIKGFFKDACSALRAADATRSADLKAFKKMIDGLIFVEPRLIALKIPARQKIGVCERPLRADTPQGPRVSLCRSQTVPAGTKLVFTITVLKDALLPYIREWLDYGALRGLGQWRNSGKGRFTWKEI